MDEYRQKPGTEVAPNCVADRSIASNRSHNNDPTSQNRYNGQILKVQKFFKDFCVKTKKSMDGHIIKSLEDIIERNFA
jgi:hypothetical protein